MSSRLSPSVHHPEGTPGPPQHKLRTDIQGLRAVAVGMVILAHAEVPGTQGGFAGVDVFFVISGFVITASLMRDAESGSISIRDFYARRARRILPAASVTLVVTLWATYQFLGIVRAKETMVDALWASAFAVNWRFAEQGVDYFAEGLPPSPLQHFWSLAVEEQFYLVWPAILILVLWATGRRRAQSDFFAWRRTVIGVALLIFAFSLAWSIHSTVTEPNVAYFSAFTRAWELSVGALLALLAHQTWRISRTVRFSAGWLGIAAIFASVLILEEGNFPGYSALLPVIGTAFVILAGMGSPIRGGVGSVLLSHRPARTMGDWSYSLYLWHWPFLVVGAGIIDAQANPTVAQNLLLIGLAVVASGISYHLVEWVSRLKVSSPLELRQYLLLWPASFVLVLVAALAVRSQTLVVQTEAAAGFSPSTDSSASGPEVSEDAVTRAVAASLAAASSGDAVPASLVPAPSRARDDSWTREVNCGVSAPKTTTADLCVIGNVEGDLVVAAIGDSHMGMWLPALTDIAERESIAIHPFVKYGCTANDLTLAYESRSAQDECRDWRDWAVAELERLKPDVIVVSTRAGFAIADEDSGERLEREDAFTAFERGVGSGLTTYSELAERVVVFSDTPVSEFDPVACVDQPGNVMQDCVFTPGNDFARANSMIASEAARVGVDFLDLTPWFCSTGRCPSVVENMLVYFDPGHITRTYATSLAPFLEKDLKFRISR